MGYANFFRLAGCIVLCLMAGFIGSFFTVTGVDSWYSNLEKPSFNPPNWVFGPVWTILYILMGISLYLIWKSDLELSSNIPQIGLFLAQLVFNSLWSIVFFGLQQLFWALIVIIILWTLILLSISYFKKISKTAAILLIPYLLWVSFATLLNYSIIMLN
ncbi:MAG: tryptophan-rich sensory protein [Candidatus Altiarchaeales archaeon]|nr:tryptophan-rich sensory protein [Candidatus Altiarchaeales archaeon]